MIANDDENSKNIRNISSATIANPYYSNKMLVLTIKLSILSQSNE